MASIVYKKGKSMKNEVNNKYTGKLETVLELREPSFYHVWIHNDDFTPMEFVVTILERFFFLDRRAATNVMLEAHMKGQAIIGRYTKDVAETKISAVMEYAGLHEHPLVCSMEEIVNYK